MIRAAITGSIASGKSTVSAFLRSRGWTVIDYDMLAREVLEDNTFLRDAIRAAFGDESFDDVTRKLNRQWMADHVFSDPEKLELLNNLMHPVIYSTAAQLDALYAQAGEPIVFHDIPLLFSSQDAARAHGLTFDSIMMIDAPADIRIERMMNSRGMTKAQAVARINSQLDLEPYKPEADAVISSLQSIDDMLAEVESTVCGWLSAASR